MKAPASREPKDSNPESVPDLQAGNGKDEEADRLSIAEHEEMASLSEMIYGERD